MSKSTKTLSFAVALISSHLAAAPPSPSVEVTVVGSGVVTSEPVAIQCREDSGICVSEFSRGDVVTLTATSDAKANFVNWGGACEGTEPMCTLNLKSGTKTVSASFESVKISYPAPVQATGQASCWDANGYEIACEGTGQDGESRLGIPFASPRFTDIGNGSVLDNTTGLIWLQNVNCVRTNYPELLDETYDGVVWQMALDFVEGINSGTYYCGTTATDWRLPNARELQSLIDFEAASSLPPPFENGFNHRWWSSTSRPVNESQAYDVLVRDGLTRATHKHWPYATVIAVRSIH
jgi:hypothetical protein